jgi:DnaD/phage-associated family protein
MSESKPEYKIEGRPSTIFRVVKSKDNPYVMIDRRPIENKNLSYKAKGILTYLMSRPDGWEVNITDLRNHGKEGAAALRTGLKELRDAHHVCYHVDRDGGRITGWLIEVYEIPYDLPMGEQAEGVEAEISPDDDFQQVENQQVENRRQVLSTLSNNEKEIKKNDEAALATISKAYQSEIGMLTPMIREELIEASTAYPVQWTLDAIHESASMNKRAWKYVLAILTRWKAQGNQEAMKPQYPKTQGALKEPKGFDAIRQWASKQEDLVHGN